jgi:hypothetical protein
MQRTLKILFRRDPSRDREDDRIHFQGYEILWPDGQPVAVGLDAFCKQGQHVLGLRRYLAGCRERLLEVVCIPLPGRDQNMTRLPGQRVRRFFLERHGRQGRIHFLDGTPTAVVFDEYDDEPAVLHWVGFTGLKDGERQWFDLAACPLEESVPHPVNGLRAAVGDQTLPTDAIL